MIRKDTDKEPVCFGTFPVTFYKAILNGYMLKTVLDLTVGSGAFAQACLLTRCGHAKVSYFGICLSEAHMNAIRERLVHFVLKQMITEGSPLYVVKCAEALGSKTPEKKTPEKKVGGGGASGSASSGNKGTDVNKRKRGGDGDSSKDPAKGAKDGGKRKKGAKDGESSWDVSDDGDADDAGLDQ